ncbi:type II toxin-antitoxin system HicB family antitoxin [Caulobacter sp. S45]|uniref:type II toxin-antitoxin system HicB family antitoxin n=1 Tax=Caulobacter sp. S45 TaxID=1641861 RepID=UPI00157725D5|nr:type II toxin-antitoxin system HicB family antitoxin [Caulobacter sp. S45]
MAQYYVALIHKDETSDFGVSFPDFPGCVSAGSTMHDAIVGAEEALRGHVSAMVEAGEPVPEPSTIDNVLFDPDNRGGQAVLVRSPMVARKTVRVNITLYEDVLAEITSFAESKGQTRSGFLVSAARKIIKTDGLDESSAQTSKRRMTENNVISLNHRAKDAS